MTTTAIVNAVVLGNKLQSNTLEINLQENKYPKKSNAFSITVIALRFSSFFHTLLLKGSAGPGWIFQVLLSSIYWPHETDKKILLAAKKVFDSSLFDIRWITCNCIPSWLPFMHGHMHTFMKWPSVRISFILKKITCIPVRRLIKKEGVFTSSFFHLTSNYK